MSSSSLASSPVSSLWSLVTCSDPSSLRLMSFKPSEVNTEVRGPVGVATWFPVWQQDTVLKSASCTTLRAENESRSQNYVVNSSGGGREVLMRKEICAGTDWVTRDD